MDWKEAFNYGVPFVILAAVGFAAWRAGRYVLDRMLDEEHGIVTQWLTENRATQESVRQFMASKREHDAKNIEICARHATALESTTHDMSGLKSAALEGCQLCRVWAEAFPAQRDQIKLHVNEMERIIKQG